MAGLVVDFHRTASTTASLGSVVADATRPRRGRLFYVTFGSEAAPADQAMLWAIQRCTTEGTNTDVVPQAMDPAQAATESDAGENHSAEPTYTSAAFVLSIAVNQKNTFQWRAGKSEDELVYPATASNGFGIHTPTITSGTPVITATWHYREE